MAWVVTGASSPPSPNARAHAPAYVCLYGRRAGSWYAVFDALSTMAVITNAFLVAFSSSWLLDVMLASVSRFNVVVRRLGHPRTAAARERQVTLRYRDGVCMCAGRAEPRPAAADDCGLPSRVRAGIRGTQARPM
jgi:hypothetical protein